MDKYVVLHATNPSSLQRQMNSAADAGYLFKAMHVENIAAVSVTAYVVIMEKR